ncbi:hypothetical protein DL93DRAFT_154234 [Clavulina sp. PMI_390]|nr:hypothetical protein DL93DRAFT_154234 [Clavulina sp. PMI_390]
MTCEQCRKHFSYKYDLGQYTSDSTTSSSPWTLPLGTRLTCSQRHAVCSPCLYQHVASRLGTNTMPGGPLSPAGAIMSPVIGCLTCGEEISDEEALRVLPSHLIEPWCERKSQPIRIPSIMACPNPSCMGQIMQPEAWDNRAQQSCLACGTFVCVHCRSPWHNGMSCGKYQKQAQSPATLKKSIWSSSGESILSEAHC